MSLWKFDELAGPEALTNSCSVELRLVTVPGYRYRLEEVLYRLHSDGAPHSAGKMRDKSGIEAGEPHIVQPKPDDQCVLSIFQNACPCDMFCM